MEYLFFFSLMFLREDGDLNIEMCVENRWEDRFRRFCEDVRGYRNVRRVFFEVSYGKLYCF